MNSHLQTKLQAFAAEPPEGVWQKIVDAMDADQPFAQRLYQYEEVPPATAWSEIEKDLATPTPATVVPFFTRFKKPLRYAAVACFFAIVLVTITLTVRRTEAGALDPNSNTTVPVSNSSLSSAAQKEDKVQAVVSSNERKTRSNSSTVIKDDGLQTSNPNVSYASLNEYVFFNDGDGKRRRVSKKLLNLVRCGDSDAACQLRLQRLRQRLAAQATTTDFTGILEMMRQLQ